MAGTAGRRRGQGLGQGLGRRGLLVLPFLGARAGSAAEGDFPNRPVTIIVPFPPGGATDAIARPVAAGLQKVWGQSVVLQNRGGGGGAIGMNAAQRLPADGYSALIQHVAWSSIPAADALFGRPPSIETAAFTPISLLPVGPLLMAVPTDSPAKTVKDWVEIAKTRQTSMASYGQASVPHLASADFNARFGTKIEVIHYKGEGPMWIDVVSGVVQGGIGSYVALSPHLAKGTVRVLASVGSEKSPKLPQVTSFVSQGFEGQVFKLDGCLAMLAPAGTPADIVKRMGDLFVEAAESPKGLALREAFAIDAKPTTTAVAQQRWRDESPIWVRLTEQTGIKLD